MSSWFTLNQMRCSVDRTQKGLQKSFVSWPPQAVTDHAWESVVKWVPYKAGRGSSFSSDRAEFPPPPFPDSSMNVAHKTKIAVKEAGFHFGAGGGCMVFSIGCSLLGTKERWESSQLGVSATSWMSSWAWALQAFLFARGKALLVHQWNSKKHCMFVEIVSSL